MASHENYQAPFDTDSETLDPDLAAAQDAWVQGELSEERSDSFEIGMQFVGRWQELVSRTNWEKGHIISQWRQALIASGVPSTQYSDETWAQQVGGVTAPHVGRLRRVYDHFGDTCESYPDLSWTHFLVAMDWDDAPLWLQGASDGNWSVSAMRRQRWETLGGSPDEDPGKADIAANDLDEDFVGLGDSDAASLPALTQPAQGGGSSKKYEGEPGEISAGPLSEGPDFGDEDSLERLPAAPLPSPYEVGGEASDEGALVQPFAGLPALPDDLADAVELLKLAIVRHKASGWQAVEVGTMRSYLSAFLVLIDARSR